MTNSANRYPTEEELFEIENWKGTPRELIEYIANLWAYKSELDWEIKDGRDLGRRKVFKVSASTWGWSGNEDIIAALKGTWFDFMFAWSWRRGGHYEWQLSPTMIDKPDMGGRSWGNIKSEKTE